MTINTIMFRLKLDDCLIFLSLTSLYTLNEKKKYLTQKTY